FAQDVNYPGVENVEQLKEHVRKRLEDNKKNTAESVADGKLLEELRNITTVVIPEVMIEEEVQNQVNGLVNQLQSYGMSLTSYLQMTGLDTDGFKNQFREQAETDVKTRLALDAVAKAEGMTATPEQIDEEMQSLADMYQMSVDQVRQYVDPNLVAMDLTNGRAYEFIKKIAKEAAGIVTEEPKAETSEEE
ncbi:MAG: trigger factor, partial [Solobacterium sp.]|nr:trigger factor [Solobacterium sp.]